MFCPGCGKALPDGSQFCSGCGKNIRINTGPKPVEAKTGITDMVSKLSGMAFSDKGVEQPKDGAVYSIKGSRGRHIDVYDNKCVLTTKVTLGSIVTHNATDGEKTIYYKDCLGVQFRKSGMLIGYLQLETASGSMNNKSSNFFAENTFTFDQTNVSNEKMQEVADFIKRKIDEIKSSDDRQVVSVPSFSPAEELKKFKDLLDMGIISQEEFDEKKRKLLDI